MTTSKICDRHLTLRNCRVWVKYFTSPLPPKAGLLTNKGKLSKTAGVCQPSLLFCRHALLLGTGFLIVTVLCIPIQVSPWASWGQSCSQCAVLLLCAALRVQNAIWSEIPHPPIPQWAQRTSKPYSVPTELPPYPLHQIGSFVLSASSKLCLEENSQLDHARQGRKSIRQKQSPARSNQRACRGILPAHCHQDPGISA